MKGRGMVFVAWTDGYLSCGDGVESAGGGFVGLLFVDVNRFTDIPLDEE